MNILAFPRAAVQFQLSRPSVPFDPDRIPENFCFLPRPDLENDPDYLQLIPYALFRRPDGVVWTYQRKGGDARLDGRKSVGVGGHVDEADDRGDLLGTAMETLRRELAEELIHPPISIPNQPVAWINEQESPVGRVHLGLVWEIPWTVANEPCPRNGEALKGLGFVSPSEVTVANGFERWSEIACSFLTASSR